MRSGERTTGTEVLEGTDGGIEGVRAGVGATLMPCIRGQAPVQSVVPPCCPAGGRDPGYTGFGVSNLTLTTVTFVLDAG